MPAPLPPPIAPRVEGAAQPAGAHYPPVPALPRGGRPCLNCGESGQGAFCSTCGQEYENAGEVSVRLTFGDLVDELVQVNRDFLRTLAGLVRRPGQLTLDFLEGRRTNRVSPAKLFVVVNFVAFLVGQWLQPDTAKDVVEMVGMGPVEAGARGRGVSLDHFGADLAGRLGSLVPAYFFVLVPLFGLGLMLLYAGARRPFAAHAAFSFHFFALALLALAPSTLFAATGGSDAALSVALFGVIPVWTVLAMHRVYGDGWAATIVRAVVAWMLFVGSLALYYLAMVRLALLTA